MKIEKNLRDKIEYFLYENDSFEATAARFLLMTLAMGGIVFAGAVLPGILKAVSGSRKFRRYDKKQYKSAINNLKQRKLIKIISEIDGKIRVELSNKGLKRLKEFTFENLSIQKPKKWDGKWRVVIFDVPVKPKKLNIARNALREKIKRAWISKTPA